MKMEITVKGCPFEDKETLNTFAHSLDFALALHDAYEHTRRRLKEDISKEEEEFLKRLLDILHIDQNWEF